MERFEATPLRVINEVGHAWGVRMGTRLQYDLCSHVYSHYPSTAKGSLLPPLWLKYHCRSPEKTIANAEAVHLLLSLWLRTDHSCINKEHIHIGENLRFTYIYIYIYIIYIYIYCSHKNSSNGFITIVLTLLAIVNTLLAIVNMSSLKLVTTSPQSDGLQDGAAILTSWALLEQDVPCGYQNWMTTPLCTWGFHAVFARIVNGDKYVYIYM